MGALIFSLFLTLQPKPVIAVFEMRSGVKNIKGIGLKMSNILKKRSSAKVISPKEAILTYPGNLIEDFNACNEETKCIAKIGKKLTATDFIYINIVKLDNIIINIMRISTTNGSVRAATDLELPPNRNVSPLIIYKLLQKLFPPSFFKQYGSITINSNVNGAKVYINNKFVGKIPLSHKIVLPAGRRYVIKVNKKGYAPFQISLRLAPRADLNVDASLSKEIIIKGESKPWYKNWWLWTGVVVLSSVAIGATYYFTKPEETDVWITIQQ